MRRCPHCDELIPEKRGADMARLFETFDRIIVRHMSSEDRQFNTRTLLGALRAASAAIGNDSEDDVQACILSRERREPGFIRTLAEAR